ncbi:MAG: hypothetical protein Q8Q89_03425 [bacterium]|nr:hypothetical protein [bacterium]
MPSETETTTTSEAPTETQTKSSVPTTPTVTEYTQKEVERLHNWMIAVVVGVVIAFTLGYFTFLYDIIQEKELYLQYSKLYTNYLEKNTDLERKVLNSEIEINNFRNEIDLLKAKNQYLK